jgi:hypothetical protein
MNRKKFKITQEQIDDGLPAGKHFVGGGTGLLLRVYPNGSSQWVARVTVRGRRREMGLGSPLYVTLEEAVDQCRANKAICIRGGDPIEIRKLS